MSRFWMFRIGAAAVALIVGLIVMHVHKGASSDSHLKAAHAMIKQVDGYDTKPDYYDWLVEDAHEHCFGDSYHMESRGRYGTSDASWFDSAQYKQDLFDYMINQAKSDHAPQVADALERFRKQYIDPPTEVRPRDRAATASQGTPPGVRDQRIPGAR